jgi:hypothetical protein
MSFILLCLSIFVGNNNFSTKILKGTQVVLITYSKVLLHLIFDTLISPLFVIIFDSGFVFQKGVKGAIINGIKTIQITKISKVFLLIFLPNIVKLKLFVEHTLTHFPQLIQSGDFIFSSSCTFNHAGHFIQHSPHHVQLFSSFTNHAKPNFLKIQKNAPKGHKYLHHKLFANNAKINITKSTLYPIIFSLNSCQKCISGE